MNKQEIYQHLKDLGVAFEATEHEAVYTMEQLENLGLSHPEAEAKNLFIRDDKKQHYYLLTVRGDAQVDLKEFRSRFGLRKLSFGSAQDLQELLGLIPGAVSPFGLLNDRDHRVELYLDEAFTGQPIAIHPNDNTATVCLQSADLIRVLTNAGCTVHKATF